MPFCYEHAAHMAMQDDIFTGTKAGDCITGCIQVDSDHWPHAPLLRVPIYHMERAGVPNVYELWQLIEEVVNGKRFDCAYERSK